MSIEKNIFQMNKNHVIINSSLNLFQLSWKRCNPKFKYTFFTDIDCEQFINNKAPDLFHIYRKIMEINNKALFVDWFRFLYIFIVGGIYTDIDTICLKSFDKLFYEHRDKRIIVGLDADMNTIEDAKHIGRIYKKSLAIHTFISVSNHPLFKLLLDRFEEYIMNYTVDKDIPSFGSKLFNNIIYENLSKYKNDIEILGMKTFSNGLHIPHSGCTKLRNCNISYSTHFDYNSIINKDIIPFNRSPINPNNFHCEKCNRLNGTLQDWEQSSFYNNINKTLFSLWNYIPRQDELDIFLITHNNENYFKLIFPSLKKCLDENLKTNWLIYENGSTDDTKNLLKTIFDPLCKCYTNYDKVVLDNYIPSEFDFSNTENLQYIKSMQTNSDCKIGLRCEKIAWAREKVMELEIDNNLIGKQMPFPKWCLLIDTDVIFDYEHTVKQLLIAAKENPDGVMFCSNGQCINNHMYDFYYDTFALDYGLYLWDNNVMGYLHKKFGNSNVCKVKTAFGGVVLIRKEVLNLSSWSTYCNEAKNWKGYKIYGMSEHYSFCEDVRRFGEIYIVKNAICHWLQDNSYVNNEKIPTLSVSEVNAIQMKHLLEPYLQL
jgi:hypothetical protein